MMNVWGRTGIPLLHRTRRRYSYSVVECAEITLNYVHQSTSLPWWIVITGVTVSLRSIVTLPLAVKQNRIITHMELLQPTIKEYSEALKHNVVVKCKREGFSLEETNRRYRTEVRKMIREVYSNEGCHPLKVALLPWIQVPLWIIISLALRNMSGVYTSGTAIDSLSTGGVLWFSDLSLPDPLYILPVILSSSNLLNIEMHALKRKRTSTGRFQLVTTKFFRFLSIWIGFIATQLPAAMTLYWSVSSLFSLIQNSLIMLPRIRRILKIPKTPNESPTPYKDIFKNLNEKGQEFVKKQKFYN